MDRETFHWLVGLDLSPRGAGALAFGRWLHESTGGRHHLHGVHVVPDPRIAPAPALADEVERTRHYVEAAAGASFDAVEAVHGDAERALADLAVERDAFGLLIGRARRRDRWSLVALGQVARRLLRSSPKPLVVVPPDFTRADVGPGPVLLAAVPEDACVEALHVATALARSLDRELVVVHALPVVIMSQAVADPALVTVVPLTGEERIADAAQALTRWLGEHGASGVAYRIEEGGAAETVFAVAERLGAVVIVCGSRRLSLAERLFTSSMGSDLAAHADRPVVVVPPRDLGLATAEAWSSTVASSGV